MLYVIRNIHDHDLLWNSTEGWTDNYDDFDTFSEIERVELNLPMDGEWLQLVTS